MNSSITSIRKVGKPPSGFWFVLAFAGLAWGPVLGQEPEAKPRLLVLTDIGGDPDDQQSMIRLMTYANEFVIEGLIASASGTPGELGRAVTKPHLIREIVNAYGRVRDNLASHAEGFPTAEYLLRRIKTGNPSRGLDAIGEGHDTEGSRWIQSVVARSEARPVNISIWGGQTDLAQALWRVRKERGADGLKRFQDGMRVYDIADQDGLADWIKENFPGLSYILAKSAPREDRRESVFRGMYLGGDESLTSRAWVDANIRTEHGPLGALYPTRTWTAPNPHSTIKEGDTPSWFFFLANGLNAPDHPDWGGWGGRFARQDGWWRDAVDTVKEETHRRVTVWRWRPAFQAAFAARLDWCVRLKSEANHQPTTVIDGDSSMAIVRRKAPAGQDLTFDAAGSTDPDGDRLRFHWWQYAEAGTGEGAMEISDPSEPRVAVKLPSGPLGRTYHLVLEVRDDGEPSLTSYRRMVLERVD